jgi:hypothetical protein
MPAYNQLKTTIISTSTVFQSYLVLQGPIPDALNMIDMARTHIQNCEYEISAIRARLDEIADDVVSREEMKGWIKSERS